MNLSLFDSGWPSLVPWQSIWVVSDHWSCYWWWKQTKTLTSARIHRLRHKSKVILSKIKTETTPWILLVLYLYLKDREALLVIARNILLEGAFIFEKTFNDFGKPLILNSNLKHWKESVTSLWKMDIFKKECRKFRKNSTIVYYLRSLLMCQKF